MFEIAELGQKLSKKEYKQQVPELRTRLLEAQQLLQEKNLPVLVLISGVDGGGKGQIINLLNTWMDPRGIQTHAFGLPTEDQRSRPEFWRYWMALPPRGQVSIFVGSWYSSPIADRVSKKTDNSGLDERLIHINNVERELTDDGMLIIKCWVHMSKDQQEKRLRSFQQDPDNRWRVTKKDIEHLKLYDKFVGIAERVIRETSTGHCPWLIVDGFDIKHSSVTVGEHILARINAHVARQEQTITASPAPTVDTTEQVHSKGLLQSLDMTRTLTKSDYKNKLKKYQGQLNLLAREARTRRVSALLVFEGWDAGGKGGAIRRITHALDARQYRVIPIAAPTDEEKAHHYLWRFWRHVPRAGQITIYDRSWYGRVLVERVEGFATEDEWMRAYTEINDFEEEIYNADTVILKCWLHIDKDEQERRFKEREKISYKKYKITEEDYRNREQWEQYELAVEEMVARTSSEFAPWYMIEGNDKRYARIKILELLCQALKERLKNTK